MADLTEFSGKPPSKDPFETGRTAGPVGTAAPAADQAAMANDKPGVGSGPGSGPVAGASHGDELPGFGELFEKVFLALLKNPNYKPQVGVDQSAIMVLAAQLTRAKLARYPKTQ